MTPRDDDRPSLIDQLVTSALYDLADDWVTQWLIRLAWVVFAACAGAVAWALLYYGWPS